MTKDAIEAHAEDAPDYDRQAREWGWNPGVFLGMLWEQVKTGDRVYGLPGGGGYAELATIHQSLAMPIPESLDFIKAAAIPEAFFTAHDALVTRGRLAAGERVLIHAGGSGVGTAAIQIARVMGAEVFTTVGTEDKRRAVLDLGAKTAVNYRQEDFASVIRAETKGKGVDVILDVVGAAYWESNIESLARRGRLVLVGTMAGTRAEVDIRRLMTGRLEVIGTVMRARSLEERAEVTRRYREEVEPHIAQGTIRPVVDKVFPLAEAAEAHRHMGANRNIGKIVLDVREAE